MLKNKDRKLTGQVKVQSRAIADAAAETDTTAQALLTVGYDFNGWVAGLTDEGIIDGIEDLEDDLNHIRDWAVDVQKDSAKVIGRIWEIRLTLDKLKTLQTTNTKKQDGERWERLQAEEANK